MNQTHEPSLSKHNSFLYISIDNWEKNNMDVIGVKTHGLQWWYLQNVYILIYQHYQ